MPIIINGEEFLRSKEAAEIAGRQVDTIALWCRQGKIECIKDGSDRWLIKQSSLEAFLFYPRGQKENDIKNNNN